MTRHRLTLLILGVVALFVAGVAATVVSRSRQAPEELLAAPSRDVQMQMKEVDVREESGNVRWHLLAENARVYEPEGRTHLQKVRVDVVEPNRTWHIVGEEGDAFPNRKDIEIRRNVVVTSSDGLRLETQVLRWAGTEKRLWTDAPVTMTRTGSVIRGTALEVRMPEDRATVAGRVEARFFRSGAP